MTKWSKKPVYSTGTLKLENRSWGWFHALWYIRDICGMCKTIWTSGKSGPMYPAISRRGNPCDRPN